MIIYRISIKWHLLSVTFSHLQGHCCCWKPFYLAYIWKYSMYYLLYVYIWIGKQFQLFSKTELFKATTVIYIVCMVISQKRCQIELLLLRIGNRKWHMAYQMDAIPMTLSHFQGHSVLQAFQVWFFVQLCIIWQDFDWHGASHGASAIAELVRKQRS